jgi:hypothetical protein
VCQPFGLHGSSATSTGGYHHRPRICQPSGLVEYILFNVIIWLAANSCFYPERLESLNAQRTGIPLMQLVWQLIKPQGLAAT